MKPTFDEYTVIEIVYGNRRAARTGLPYMRHIDRGLALLEQLGEIGPTVIARAWCVHPIYQLDEFFNPLAAGFTGTKAPTNDPHVVLLAMEYRVRANAFLTGHIGSDREPHPSQVRDVNTMLIVDKIQNWDDARKHLYSKISSSEARQLDIYFMRWLYALGVTHAQQHQLEAVLDDLDR